ISSESLTTSTSVAPSARARSSPSSNPRYSATLLVARPSVTAASSSTSPSGVVSTAAAAAGPGFPREPPSTWTTTLTPGAAPSGFDVARDRRELARHARPPAIADLALAAAVADRATLALAAVDDHRDVGVVLVVGGEPLVQLVLEGLWHHAEDHDADPTHARSAVHSTICRVRATRRRRGATRRARRRRRWEPARRGPARPARRPGRPGGRRPPRRRGRSRSGTSSAPTSRGSPRRWGGRRAGVR